MAAQAGLCLAWSETPEDMFCRDEAQLQLLSLSAFNKNQMLCVYTLYSCFKSILSALFCSGSGQAVGPTIDSCGPFGCLQPSNTSNLGAGGLGGSLTQSGGPGVGAQNGGQGSGQGLHGPFSTVNGNNGAGLGNGGGSSGPFATGSGNNSTASGPFAAAGGSWQSGSANGKGWATGGISGPFSNGQGSGASSGPFHNNGGNNGGFSNGNGSGGNGGFPSIGGGVTSTGTNNNSSGSYGGAPGTAPGGPFQMHTGTGDGLPYSPFSVAAGNNGGNGAGNGPFAGAGGGSNNGPFASAGGGSSSGPFAGAGGGSSTGSPSASAGSGAGPFAGVGVNSGPFSQASGGAGASAGFSSGPFGGQTGTSHLTDGSGGILEPSVGGYSSMKHGSSFTWGSNGPQNGGQSPFSTGQSGSAGTGQRPFAPQGFSGNGSPASGSTTTSGSKLLEELKDCPDTLACMTTCAKGYQLHGLFENGCPACICTDTGTVGGTLIQEKPRTGI